MCYILNYKKFRFNYLKFKKKKNSKNVKLILLIKKKNVLLFLKFFSK
jgi:hypothetical protein